jgi:2-(1,2-epoxy-1,2-dihydrophenyl)acetyl-CoA isomerase
MGGARVERSGDVTVVSIDNPELRNAIDDETRHQLLAALEEANQDSSRVVVLSGEGTSFCAGGELRSMPTDPAGVSVRLGEMHSIVRAILLSDKPFVAAVEGHAFGSGVSLAAACDLVVAGATAQFGLTFGRVGLMPDCGLLLTLAGRVGAAGARRLALQGAIMDAPRAHQLGIVDELVNDGDARRAGFVAAQGLAQGAPLAMRAIKRMSWPTDEVNGFLQRELEEQTILFQSVDFAAARQAFFDRQKPSFSGK